MPRQYTPRVSRTCRHCLSVFQVPPSRVLHGTADFCTLPCRYAFQRALPAMDRFWAKVDRSGTCWLWRGKLTRYGYGLFCLQRDHPVATHRYSYEQHSGSIPIGLLVCHTCDVRNCVNPDHLFLGTHRDNTLDCVAKGRFADGERNGHAKLTEAQVREIRRRHAAGGVRQKDIALNFGVSRALIGLIVTHKSWTHLAD